MRLRTVQFEVTAVCPVEGGEPPVTLPIAVWVEWPAGVPQNYNHEMCDGKHYRVTRESASKDFGIHFGQAWLCEHQGRLIE